MSERMVGVLSCDMELVWRSKFQYQVQRFSMFMRWALVLPMPVARLNCYKQVNVLGQLC
jgi:hypothetical protein